MVIIHIERGRMIDAHPEIVSCMWDNWEIYDALLDRKFNIERNGERTWIGKFQGVKAIIELISKEEEGGKGTFKYLVSGKMLGLHGVLLFTLRYSTTADQKASVFGVGHAEVSGIMGLLWKFFLAKKAVEFADLVIDGGEKSCTMICHDYNRAISKLTEEQRSKVDSYLMVAVRARKETEFASRVHAETLLSIVPLNSDSLIRLEVDTPRPRKIQDTRRVGEVRQALEAQWESIVGNARGFATRSRGMERSEIIAKGEEFYMATVKGGHSLYTSYICKDIDSYLGALIDSGSFVHLRIQAEGRDAMLPWETLHNGEHFLSLRVGLSRTVVSFRRGARIRLDLGGILLVGSNPLGDLQSVEREVSVISEAVTQIAGVKCKVLIGSQANRKRLLEELESGTYQVLHYAGHSVYDQANPRLSHLLLAEGTKLTADELALLSLDSQVRLVFLNSCSSGALQNTGFSTVGLANAFVTAGVPYVIGMMWNISDEGGSILAQQFYQRLLALGDVVEALRGARVDVGGRLDWKDPVWAAPVLYTG